MVWHMGCSRGIALVGVGGCGSGAYVPCHACAVRVWMLRTKTFVSFMLVAWRQCPQMSLFPVGGVMIELQPYCIGVYGKTQSNSRMRMPLASCPSWRRCLYRPHSASVTLPVHRPWRFR
jgi:hypothetical protein